MKIRIILLLLLAAMLFPLCACQKEREDNGIADTKGTEETVNSYEQISQEEAKNIMDTQSDYIIIDARTKDEFAEGHIEGAILIPEYEIAKRAEKEFPNKDALILVYCRSGRRSKIASDELVKLGYTNVKEFGGIIDWEYETVK